MLADEARAARVNLEQVEKRLAEQDPTSGTFIGSTPAQVERFLTVHGQIILNQFRTFPIKGARPPPLPAVPLRMMILLRQVVFGGVCAEWAVSSLRGLASAAVRDSGIPNALRAKMLTRRHTKIAGAPARALSASLHCAARIAAHRPSLSHPAALLSRPVVCIAVSFPRCHLYIHLPQ